MTPEYLRAKPTERALIREELFSAYSSITFVLNDDGTYAAHVRDVTIEADSPIHLLWDLAAILEES